MYVFQFTHEILIGLVGDSVRTPVSMQYFPRFFFLYFMVFHIYIFSYEYGKLPVTTQDIFYRVSLKYLS
jgi:hypothetical protein